MSYTDNGCPLQCYKRVVRALGECEAAWRGGCAPKKEKTGKRGSLLKSQWERCVYHCRWQATTPKNTTTSQGMGSAWLTRSLPAPSLVLEGQLCSSIEVSQDHELHRLWVTATMLQTCRACARRNARWHGKKSVRPVGHARYQHIVRVETFVLFRASYQGSSH
jgi:hypothetical protein